MSKYLLVAASVIILSSSACSQNNPAKLSDVPQWAKAAVWYQIFPERFRNGDTLNDPKVSDLAGSWPHETPKEWHASSWTGDWYALQPWEKLDDKGFYYHAQERRYGGDLQGVLDKLDYLADLGVNALYFNPLFESPSLHKYDATMYHHIDNNFGPDPEGDKKIWGSEHPADPSSWQWTSADKLFLKLVHEAHRRGMKVIIDGVFNHVGMTFWAFEDVKKNQQRSFFKDWFTIARWDSAATPENEFEYKGWYDVKELPEIREDEHGLVFGPRKHIAAVVKRWMDPDGDGDPSDGIDGWRLDVADMVSLNFWKDFRSWVRSINPEAYITGEVWWEDWQNDKMFNAEPWLKGDAFDAVMNYRWAREMCHYFVDHKNKITASEFSARLDKLRQDYHTDVDAVLMNLLDSHDTDRLLSRIVNPDMLYDHHVGVQDNKEYNVRKPNEAEIQIQKLMALFQMTYFGAPMIYYGDEVGMWGGDDPDERKPMLWAEYRFDNEKSHPFGKPRPNDSNRVDMNLFQYYKSIVALRRTHDVFSFGDYRTALTDDHKDVFAFMRSYKNERALVAVNNSSAEQQVTLRLQPDELKLKWITLFGQFIDAQGDGGIQLTLPPKSGTVLGASKP